MPRPPVIPLIALCLATPAIAQVKVVPAQPASEVAARGGIDVYLVNEGAVAVPVEAPARLDVTAADATRLILAPEQNAASNIAPGGFVKLRYRPVDAAIAAVPTLAAETVVTSSNGTASGFLGRFAPYEPIYGVAGTGDSAAKLQFSFAIRPFGGTGVLSRFAFAYTQTMFWAIDRASGPFRATNYAPEVFIDLPVADTATLALGYAHMSNGEGFGSIDVNRLFVRAAKRFDLGDGWQAELVPQAWLYVGRQGAAPDLDRYWGFTGLKASIGQTDGIKLAIAARGNPGTGRGSAELFASYPLARAGDFGVYAFGQGFTGYGEALDDFRVRDTHARLGIALTR